MLTAQWGMIDAFPEAACIVDAAGRIERANPSLLQLSSLLDLSDAARPDVESSRPIAWSDLGFDEGTRTSLSRVCGNARQRGTASALVALSGARETRSARVDAARLDADHLLVTLRPIREDGADHPTQHSGDDHYRNLVQRSEGLIFAHTDDGEIISANPATAAALGLPITDLIGSNLSASITPRDRPLFRRYLDRIDRSGLARGMLHVVTAEGEERVWEYSGVRGSGSDAGAALDATNPTPNATVYAHATDVSNRQRVEDALLSSEERYRLSLDRAGDSIWLFDIDGTCLYANDAACDLLQRPRSEILTRTLADFVVEGDRTRACAFLPALQAGHRDALLTTMIRADGEEIPVEISGADLGDETFQAIGRDMSDWLRAQREIQRSEERYRTVVETPSRGFVVSDYDGVISFHNQALAQLSGLQSGWDERTLPDLFEEPDREALRAALRAAPAQAETALDVKYVHPSRGRRIFQLFLSPLPSSAEILTEVVDITNQRAIEERARQAQRMDSIGNLAAGISHDFNNLLTVIQANLSEATQTADAQIAPLLRNAETATKSAASLSQQLLAIGRASDADRASVPLRAHVDELLQLLSRTLGPHVELRTDVGDDIYAFASSTQLQHVLMNLAINAADAMPEGGTITIRGTRLAPSRPPLDMPVTQHGYVVIEVIDDGCGMDAETASRAFEPYYSTKGDAGTGLGLAMVYGIIREHDGAVSLETVPGQGTTVRITLPASPPPASVDRARRSSKRGSADRRSGTGTARSGSRPSESAIDDLAGVNLSDSEGDADSRLILVVDDRQELRDVCGVILTSAGYRVAFAADGREAVDFVQRAERPPDLLLLDSSMPGMSGRETFDTLRGSYPMLKVIIMSGFASDSLEGLQPSETWAFLQKPFERETLLGAVRQILDEVAAG